MDKDIQKLTYSIWRKSSTIGVPKDCKPLTNPMVSLEILYEVY